MCTCRTFRPIEISFLGIVQNTIKVISQKIFCYIFKAVYIKSRMLGRRGKGIVRVRPRSFSLSRSRCEQYNSIERPWSRLCEFCQLVFGLRLGEAPFLSGVAARCFARLLLGQIAR